MNLKLKRLVRTNSSEQYALFDLDQMDDAYQPTTIGKLDMHYTNEGIYGTILLWDDVSRDMAIEQRKDLVQILLDEISTPMGVPNEYVFEFFAPTLDEYEVIHNVGLDVMDEPTEGDASVTDHAPSFDPPPSPDESAVNVSDMNDAGMNDAGMNDGAPRDTTTEDVAATDMEFEREQVAAAKPFGDAPAN